MFGLKLYLPVNSYGHVEMVSSHNQTFFLGKLDQAVNQYFVYIISLVVDNNPFESAEGRKMATEIISRSISGKVWDRAGIELAALGYAGRQVTDCSMRPGKSYALAVSMQL